MVRIIISFTPYSGAFKNIGKREVAINLIKTTSTTTPATTNTYWGIFVPGAITLSGDYVGVNTLEGKTAETVDWAP